jgi:2,3,4,5-tetrahydropyridine-2-carboxylate N-succinyltransferase
MSLQNDIEQVFDEEIDGDRRPFATQIFNDFKFFLNRGEIRAAEKIGEEWKVNQWVKKGILLGFKLGVMHDVSINRQFRYFDKNTFPLKEISLNDGIRLVPGGSSIRDGAFVAMTVVCMPPMFINVGAYVDEGTMVDSHVLIGSCAQIGKRVHLSAASQIGGVLEPIGALPVIVEDEVLVGGNCGIYEGTIVKHRAVIGAGVILTGSTPVYDTVNRKVYRKQSDHPLIIPENAVVVPGTRVLKGDWAREEQLSIASPIIVKYRDEKTDVSTALEDALR